MTGLEKAWYRPRSWALLLAPLSLLFMAVATVRRHWLQRRQPRLALPVVVVGNITVGGTGKTPLIIALVQALQERGLRPGVISRGYGGKAPSYPMLVTPQSDATESGDEPLLIAHSCHCPVVVDPDRLRAARFIAEQTNCNVILSDDGLQHYRLPRDLEIVVVDGERMLGNGWCLPAGPLREPPRRLYEAQFVIVNGSHNRLDHVHQYRMELVPLRFRRLNSDETREPTDPPGEGSVHAVAGIGNPTRFARTLATLGLSVKLHPFPDHHEYRPEELAFDDGRPVILTAKDAVKCTAFNPDNTWILDVAASLENNGMQALIEAITQRIPQP